MARCRVAFVDTMTAMAPRMKKRRVQVVAKAEDPNDDHLLADLVSQMEEHMALDRILDARKVVDEIQQLSPAIIARLSPKQQEKIKHIVQESNHVQELLRDLQSDDGWTLCRSRKGITVHYRNEGKGDPIHAVKTRTILENCRPSDFVHLCSLFAESDLLPLWFPSNVLDSVEMIVEPSKYRQVLRMTMKFHYMPITDREVICEGIGYHIQEENAFLLLTKSIDESPFCDIPPTPPRMVRMETRTVFMVKLLPGRSLEFCQISHDDLKFRYVPAFVTNYLSQGTVPFELIQSMKRVMSNYNGSEWDIRVHERRDFYQEIEERVEKELMVMNVAQENNDNGRSRRIEPSRPGLSLEMALCIMAALAAITRWSFDRFQFPWWLCGICLLVSLTILTHLAYLYSHKPSV